MKTISLHVQVTEFPVNKLNNVLIKKLI